MKGVNDLERTTRKIRIGKVVGDKMDKTITVAVESQERHPIYKKYKTICFSLLLYLKSS